MRQTISRSGWCRGKGEGLSSRRSASRGQPRTWAASASSCSRCYRRRSRGACSQVVKNLVPVRKRSHSQGPFSGRRRPDLSPRGETSTHSRTSGAGAVVAGAYEPSGVGGAAVARSAWSSTRSAAASRRTPSGTSARGQPAEHDLRAAVPRTGAPDRAAGRQASHLPGRRRPRLRGHRRWHAYQQLRSMYQADPASAGRSIAEQVIASFPTSPIPEGARLGRTLKMWRGYVLARFRNPTHVQRRHRGRESDRREDPTARLTGRRTRNVGHRPSGGTPATSVSRLKFTG